MLKNKKHIHFIGIGGIGMSGIAGVLAGMGYKVSGSDLELNNLTDKLKRAGARIFKGHDAANLPKDAEVTVYSSSISRDNPEMVEAARRGIQIIHRAKMLAELLNRKLGIAVTGTHGKTTTTSLIAVMLEHCGLDPTVIIGGEVGRFRGNAKLGKGQYLVAEADESDSSFFNFKPFYSVVTNIELEHMDHFKGLDDVRSAYFKFMNNLKKGGKLFYSAEDRNIKTLIKKFKGVSESFGFSKAADIYATDIKMSGFRTHFRCVYKGNFLGEVRLEIPGRHNVLNSLAAILVGLNLGLKFPDISNAIKDFKGTKRRFHLRADFNDIMLIDDYAHHPTEIKAVVDACGNWNGRRVIAIFQPHRYTRTKFLADDFGKCFKGVDKLILTDIYAASEAPIKGVSVKNIYDRVIRSGLNDVIMIKKDNISGYVMGIKRPGDMILVLGAGDIKKVADELAERLNEKLNPLKKSVVRELKSIVKGHIVFNETMAPHTYFKIGGPASIWVEPRDSDDLKRIFIFAKAKKIPIFVIGGGSNLLVNDLGYKGIVIHLGSEYFKHIRIAGNLVTVGGGFFMPRLVKFCCDRGLGGLESLVGIPGTVGGAIYMNAGGSKNPIFKNIGDFVASLKVMDYKGNIKSLRKNQIRFGYRCSSLDHYIVLEAVLKLKKASSGILNSRCSKFLRMKRNKQVLDIPSAGCVFKNPNSSQFTCGQMIDMLGMKGMSIGGAEVSVKHANFIINRRNATAEDVSKLIETIKNKVTESFNVPLELEIKTI